MRRLWLIAPLLLTVIVSSANASGDGAEVIRARQAKFRMLIKLHRTVKAELMRPAPDAAAVARLAQQEADLARPLPSWFPVGSGAGAETYALPIIWTRTGDFESKAGALETALGQLERAAQQGSPEAMRGAQQGVAAACQACHETYLNR